MTHGMASCFFDVSGLFSAGEKPKQMKEARSHAATMQLKAHSILKEPLYNLTRGKHNATATLDEAS